jgi:hypothetical protein
MLVLPPFVEAEYIRLSPSWPVQTALRRKGDLSPLTSTVYVPLLLMAAVFSCAGTEESFTETVPLAVMSSDATPNTVDLDALEAAGVLCEPVEPQPPSTKLTIAAHTTRRAKMFFLIS